MKLLTTTIAAVVLVGCVPSAPDISIHEAVEKGNVEAVKQYLNAGGDLEAKGGWGKRTPLHSAAQFGHKEIAELLIVKGADVNMKNRFGWTPLAFAAERSHKEVVELLIAKGADVNAEHSGGTTPLDTAIGETAALLRKHGGKTAAELKAEGK